MKTYNVNELIYCNDEKKQIPYKDAGLLRGRHPVFYGLLFTDR